MANKSLDQMLPRLQKRMVPSKLAETRVLLSGEKASALTFSVCPLKAANSLDSLPSISQGMSVRRESNRGHPSRMAFQKNDDFRFFRGGHLIGPFTSGPLISSLFGLCGPALFRWQRGGWGSLRFGDRRWLN